MLDTREREICPTLMALDAIGATILAVHAETLPSLAALIAGRAYVGWSFSIPGTIGRRTIDGIAAAVHPGFHVTIAPGHPLPPPAADRSLSATAIEVDRYTARPSLSPGPAVQAPRAARSPRADEA